MNGQVKDAGTVPVRVQVIDMEPFALDLVVPTFLSAGDLTQRVARDAGLPAYWADNTRRLFWLRARGRILQEHERLDDLGIVPHELLHLLPQPPAGSGVAERAPEYPRTRGYAAAGTLNMIGGLTLVILWTLGWGLALMTSTSVLVSSVPAVGLALICTSFARHVLGGEGSSIRIPILGFFVFVPMFFLAPIPAVVWAEGEIADVLVKVGLALIPGFVFGLFGVLLAWLAWYGAVEPLPKITVAEVKQAEAQAVYMCGVCGLLVPPEHRAECKFACGQVFHTGCYAARQAVYNGPGCAVCGYIPG